jgi:nucleoside-diphosphate-sugar epimerase
MTRRVLVTGATGFLARPAVTALRERGFEVHGVARHTAGAVTDGIDVDVWHPADLLGADTAVAVVDAIDPSHTLHLAWCTEHGEFWDDPANDAWIEATLRLFDAVGGAPGGRRFVMAGSCAQYDWSDAALGADGVAHELSTPHHPATRYGKAKDAVAELIGARAGQQGISVAQGIIFFPYGPHEHAGRLVPSVTRHLLGGTVAETTAGTQRRDFVHVTDAGRALAALVDHDIEGPVNIGSGTATAVADVARTIARIVGRDDLLHIGALPERSGEPAALVADIARLRDDVGFTPAFDLESGLRDAVEWWRRQ